MESSIDIVLPADQLEGTTAKVSSWLIDVGAMVNTGDPVVELETDKVSMEVCAPATGQLQDISKFPGDDIESGAVLGKLTVTTPLTDQTHNSTNAQAEAKPCSADITAAGSADLRHSDSNHCRTDNATDNTTDNSVRPGPAARRLLREHELDVNIITGSGRNGRVTRDDVLAYLKKPTLDMPVTTAGLVGKKVPHSSMRKTIAKHMTESLLHLSPHVTSVFEMDMSNIIEHRRWHKKEFAEKGVKLTFTAYFLAATVKAMAAVPQMNARYHDDCLELFETINIGVGTALGDDGLVVPVIPQVQSKDLFAISQALQQQTEKARSGKLTPADMKNGTFTVSNHGVSGSLFAAPIIINQPQVAILGIGKLEKRVVVEDVNGEDSLQIKPMCYVSLSIDHRAVDAFQTNRFLSVFVDTINHWGN